MVVSVGAAWRKCVNKETNVRCLLNIWSNKPSGLFRENTQKSLVFQVFTPVQSTNNTQRQRTHWCERVLSAPYQNNIHSKINAASRWQNILKWFTENKTRALFRPTTAVCEKTQPPQPFHCDCKWGSWNREVLQKNAGLSVKKVGSDFCSNKCDVQQGTALANQLAAGVHTKGLFHQIFNMQAVICNMRSSFSHSFLKVQWVRLIGRIWQKWNTIFIRIFFLMYNHVTIRSPANKNCCVFNDPRMSPLHLQRQQVHFQVCQVAIYVSTVTLNGPTEHWL